MTAPSIDYVSRDFDEIKEALKTHIQTKFPNTWRDFYESSAGMAWLELVAYCFDILSYYLDVQANEVYLSTARDRLSVINICKLVGYTLSPATSASVALTATIDSVQANPVVIPAGTQITSAGGVTFEFLTDQTIATGLVTAEVTATEGTSYTDVFISDGTAFQSFQLVLPGVISGSITVTVNGVEWEQTDSLVYGDDTSQVYAISMDEDDYGTIHFGDGTNGFIPPDTATISITYRVGGGVIGNIALNQINTSVQGVLSGVSPTTYVTVDLVNDTERGSGGEARETIEHAKYWAPRYVRTNGRAVTEEDFDTLATAFSDATYGTPAYAKAMLHQEIPESNRVDLYLWSRDDQGVVTTPSTGLKTAVQAYFDNNDEGAVRLVCTDTVVLDGEIIYLDVNASVAALSSYANATVVANATTAVETLFTSTVIQPGQAFRISTLYNTLHGASGVSYAIVNSVTAAKEVTEVSGTAPGATARFIYTISAASQDDTAGTFVRPYSIEITDGYQTVTDDGSGNLVGDVDATGTNTVNYDTGEVDVTFTAAPAAGLSIQTIFRYILSYQRGEVETTASGTSARFTGTVDYPPLLAKDLSYASGIAFTDGSQVVYDDGDGNLIGDVDDYAVRNYIDYDTGAYDFTFALTPAAGTVIRSTYRQKLQTASEDIPIGKDSLSVEGQTTITAL